MKSVLQCTILDDGRFKGFVGFDECRGNRFWTQEQVDTLTFISKALAKILLSERNRRLSDNFSKAVETVLENHSSYAYVVDPDTNQLLYMNGTAKEAAGGDKAGSLCYDVVCGDKNCAECPIKDYLKNGEGRNVNMIIPSIQKVVKAHTDKIMWNGKTAYLIVCTNING